MSLLLTLHDISLEFIWILLLNKFIILYNYYYYHYYFTPCEFSIPVFAGGFSQVSGWHKSPQFSKVLLGVLADFNNTVVGMVSVLPLISNPSCLFSKLLRYAPSAPTTLVVVVGALGAYLKSLEKRQEGLEIRGRTETIPTTVLLKSPRTSKRTLETWEDLCSTFFFNSLAWLKYLFIF